MTQGKGNRDEKLIEELYEKLYWYTFEASEEEFDSKEVDAIVGLLDVIDPKEDDPRFPSEPKAAFERFKMRYGLEEEFSETAAGEAGEEEGKESGAAGTAGTGGGRDTVAAAGTVDDSGAAGSGDEASDGVSATGGTVLAVGTETYRGSNIKGTDESGNYGKKKRGSKGRKRLVRLATGVAACLVLMLSVNFGSYALKKKSFFEVVRDGIGRTKVTVTGNVEDVGDNTEYTEKYSSWEEVENEIGDLILYPSYLPNEYLLEGITIQSMTTKKRIVAVYNGGKGKKYTRLEIDIYNGDFTERTVALDDNWKLIYSDEQTEYYQNGDQIEAIFMSNNSMYFLNSNESFDVVKRIVQNMK